MKRVKSGLICGFETGPHLVRELYQLCITIDSPLIVRVPNAHHQYSKYELQWYLYHFYRISSRDRLKKYQCWNHRAFFFKNSQQCLLFLTWKMNRLAIIRLITNRDSTFSSIIVIWYYMCTCRIALFNSFYKISPFYLLCWTRIFETNKFFVQSFCPTMNYLNKYNTRPL